MYRPTLVEQFVRDQAAAPGARGDLSTIFNRLSLAGRMTALEIMRAGLLDRLGYTGDTNVQDEDVRQLDVIANEIFIDVFKNAEAVAGVASEEMEDIHVYENTGTTGRYVVLFDPLDGSGNVDIDGAMGSIWSVHRRLDTSRPVSQEDFLREGSEQVAAGYILYGPSTMFVYTAGGPVNGFTLDRSIGTFFLTHPNMQVPEGQGSYSVNEANRPSWDDNTVELVRRFRHGLTRCGKRSARYVGALVADFHRTLVRGGIYMYPGTAKKPRGKLRLLYECAPLAMMAELAGGAATDGKDPILSLKATELHERVPLFLGSKADVAEATEMVQGRFPEL